MHTHMCSPEYQGNMFETCSRLRNAVEEDGEPVHQDAMWTLSSMPELRFHWTRTHSCVSRVLVQPGYHPASQARAVLSNISHVPEKGVNMVVVKEMQDLRSGRILLILLRNSAEFHLEPCESSHMASPAKLSG